MDHSIALYFQSVSRRKGLVAKFVGLMLGVLLNQTMAFAAGQPDNRETLFALEIEIYHA